MEWKRESLREALGKSLEALGRKNPDVMVVNADLVNSVKSFYFSRAFPERTVEVGIAEQNMIGVAAGLAKMGYIPFALTFASSNSSFFPSSPDSLNPALNTIAARIPWAKHSSNTPGTIRPGTHTTARSIASGTSPRRGYTLIPSNSPPRGLIG